jgi:DNA-binding NarL/FixJ family response regulator
MTQGTHIEHLVSSLTPKQLEVISYLHLGYHRKKIAKHMDISFRTVQSHIEIIKRKSKAAILLFNLDYELLLK